LQKRSCAPVSRALQSSCRHRARKRNLSAANCGCRCRIAWCRHRHHGILDAWVDNCARQWTCSATTTWPQQRLVSTRLQWGGKRHDHSARDLISNSPPPQQRPTNRRMCDRRSGNCVHRRSLDADRSTTLIRPSLDHDIMPPTAALSALKDKATARTVKSACFRPGIAPHQASIR